MSSNWLRYFNSFFTPRNIVSLLILLAPFSLGKFPILSFNYIYYTYIFIIILFFQLFNEIPNHLRLINNKILFLVLLLVLSFFLSMLFGLDYKVIGDLTDFDSSFNGVLLSVFTFVPMQLLLIFLIFVSVNSFDDIEYYLKMFFISGLIVNSVAFYQLTTNFSGRLGAVFSDVNYLGRFEIFIISLSLIYILFKTKNKNVKLLLFSNIIISFVFLYFSYSRSAILTLGLNVSIILMFLDKKHVKYIFILSIFVIISIAFSYVTSARVTSPLGGSNNVFYNILLEPSNFTRIILNIAGFNMFLDFPIFGVGYHNFYNAYINYSYIPLELTLYFSRNNSVIHSWLFSVFAEQGLFGAVPLILLLGLIFKKLYHSIKNKELVDQKYCSISLFTLIFVLVVNGLFFPVFYTELIFSLIIGIIAGYFKLVFHKYV